MESLDIVDLVPELSDLELAIFLSLVAREHCLIETKKDAIDDVAKELALICLNTFNLSCVILDCSSETSLDNFGNGMLVSDARRVDHHGSSIGTRGVPDLSSDYPSFRSIQESREYSRSGMKGNYLDDKRVANVVIAKNFNRTDEHVQIHVLEQILRSKRIFTKTAVHSTPKAFLFIPVVASNDNDLRPLSLNKHLNDHIFISHVHDPQDGYPNLEEDDKWLSDDRASISSVIRKSDTKSQKRLAMRHKIDEEAITKFQQLSDNVTVCAEVTRYLQDIVVFLRLNRAVAGGVSAKATFHLFRLSKCLAPLHGIDYLTPSIVALAAKKVYRHRIIVASAENDRSLQYGSNPIVVSRLLMGVSPETIIDDIIGEVEAPL
ncbi:hypothetical protein VTN00DRAFT_4135 [Thermoascus crustaceus]|uniref:uncharacterized protein n=1 Tax=Thermoascus crustaceus TaxID=5088 RepID=UPI003743B0C8